MKTTSRGFTLIEMMIAVAVVGILAAVALPSYKNSIQKSKRADAHASLMKVQLAQENWRANNSSYGTLAQLGLGSTSADGYYTISITGNTGTGYVATAAPAGTQVGDSCGNISINVTNGSPTYGPSSACWGR